MLERLVEHADATESSPSRPRWIAAAVVLAAIATELSIVAIASAADWSTTLFYVVSGVGLVVFLAIALPVLAPPRRVNTPSA